MEMGIGNESVILYWHKYIFSYKIPSVYIVSHKKITLSLLAINLERFAGSILS